MPVPASLWMQLPETHTWPQPPQLKGSLVVSTQVPPQFTIVGGPPSSSLQRQVPCPPPGLSQCWLEAHSTPQPPQLPSSWVVSTQAKPASVWHSAMPGVVVEHTHWPRMQLSPSAQALPQPLQLLASFWMSVHTLGPPSRPGHTVSLQAQAPP